MSEIENIKRYIERTAIPHNLCVRYDCCPQELLALLAENHPYEAMSFAFRYGKAKGYRAGKKAVANI